MHLRSLDVASFLYIQGCTSLCRSGSSSVEHDSTPAIHVDMLNLGE